jgi:multiple sugar transport system permease protein
MQESVTYIAAPSKKENFWKKHKGLSQWLIALPFIGPTLIGFTVFVIGPIIASFVLSFTSWDLLTPPQWIGLENYRFMVGNTLFWTVIQNTFLYLILYVPAAIVLPLLVAILLNRPLKGISIFRAVYFLPVVTSTVAVALAWMWLYNPQYGVVNFFLKIFGIQGPRWLADPRYAMLGIAIMSIWKVLGYNMVIYLAGLQGIPDEYYEVASIDGANAIQKFIHITLPLISPTTFFVLIISIINSFQIFEQTYVMTQGGPANSTLTIALHIYQMAFQFHRMGYASALAYILFLLTLVVSLIQLWLQKKWVFYS